VIFFNAVASNRSYMNTCLRLAEEKLKENLLICPLLFSFAYPVGVENLFKFLNRNGLILDHVMLDSGAPTVWSKGLHIDLDDYSRFILWVRDYKRIKRVTCVSLDVIRAKRDVWNIEEMDRCAETSLKNFLYFKTLGIDSIAVYHYGEQRKWLDKILEHTNHVGLGGMHKLQKKSAHREWLDGTWDYLEKQNVKDLKVHGFAQTSISGMQRYPWHSVDSTSALMSAAMGRVYLPGLDADGSYNFSRCNYLAAGDRTFEPDHARWLGRVPEAREKLVRYLHSIGHKWDDLFDPYKRVEMNVKFFRQFVRRLNQRNAVHT